jgi:hypothetical protein
VGFPIRISTDQSLLAAPRGFSQRATSFIASWCQGIHRMPLLRSRSCGYTSRRRCIQPPCTGTIHPDDVEPHDPTHRHTQSLNTTASQLSTLQWFQPLPLNKDGTLTPLNTYARLLATPEPECPPRTPISIDLAEGPRPVSTGQTVATKARPETHQNLIYSNKEQTLPSEERRPTTFHQTRLPTPPPWQDRDRLIRNIETISL